ncbi:MAG: hypothetical protein HC888_10440 [Candidatus Competibacteraceae bacterium]|nr:hypothetical protein [Candidatus Competibacteraceae bacterium]
MPTIRPPCASAGAETGTTPRAPGRQRYEWLYVYGWVNPESGETFWLLLPTVNKVMMNVALKAFAEHLGLSATRRVALVWDNAGWHRGLELPEGLDVICLPAYSPELQPAERLWELVDEPIANRMVADMETLKDILCRRCVTLMNELGDLVRGRTLFYWWPRLYKVTN